MIRDTNMRCAEREEHHEDLVADGFEWCPECGMILYCRPDHIRDGGLTPRSTPVVTGDCPPLSSDDLLPHV
jgi:hypothetical protein